MDNSNLFKNEVNKNVEKNEGLGFSTESTQLACETPPMEVDPGAKEETSNLAAGGGEGVSLQPTNPAVGGQGILTKPRCTKEETSNLAIGKDASASLRPTNSTVWKQGVFSNLAVGKGVSASLQHINFAVKRQGVLTKAQKRNRRKQQKIKLQRLTKAARRGITEQVGGAKRFRSEVPTPPLTLAAVPNRTTYPPAAAAFSNRGPTFSPALAAVRNRYPTFSSAPAEVRNRHPTFSSAPAKVRNRHPTFSSAPAAVPIRYPIFSSAPAAVQNRYPTFSSPAAVHNRDSFFSSAVRNSSPTFSPAQAAVGNRGPTFSPAQAVFRSRGPTPSLTLAAVPNRGPTSPPTLDAVPNRAPTSSPAHAAVPNRACTVQPQSCAQALNTFKVFIVREAFPLEKLSQDDIECIQMEILRKTDMIPFGNDMPKIQKSAPHAGTLLVYCDDAKTADWIKATLHGNDEVIDGTVLQVLSANDLPKPVKIAFKTKDIHTKNVQLLLSRLNRLNPELKSEEWRFIQKVEGPYTIRWIFEVNWEAAEVIKKADYGAYTGLDRGTFKILNDPNRKTKEAQVEPSTSSQEQFIGERPLLPPDFMIRNMKSF